MKGTPRSGCEVGAAAVEMGVVLPILILLVFGIIDFGRAFNAQLSIQHAVREGVRVLAITKDTSLASSATTAAATGVTLNSVNPTGCPGSTTAQVSATSVFTFTTPLFGGTRTLSATGRMRCGG